MKKRSIYLIMSVVIFAAFMSFNGCKSSKKMAGATKPAENTEATKQVPAEKPETKPEETTAVKVTMTQKLENYFDQKNQVRRSEVYMTFRCRSFRSKHNLHRRSL